MYIKKEWRKAMVVLDGDRQQEERENRTDPDEYRMVILVRRDLKMGFGKTIAQVAHAMEDFCTYHLQKATHAYACWKAGGMTKITLEVNSEAELLRIAEEAEKHGIYAHVVVDAGRTQVLPGSRTVGIYGPAGKEQTERISGHLRLM